MIVPMQYVTLVFMRADREAVLRALQKDGSIMLCETDHASHTDASAGVALRRMEKLIAELKPYTPKKGLLAEKPQATVEEFETVTSEAVETAATMETLLESIAQSKERLAQLQDLQQALLPWVTLSAPVETLAKSAYVRYTMGVVSLKGQDALLQACQENGADAMVVSKSAEKAYLLVADMPDAPGVGTYTSLEPVLLPISKGLVRDALSTAEKQIAQVEETLADSTQKLKALSAESHVPQLLCEQYRAQSDLEAAPFFETAETVFLEGWVPKARLEQLEAAVRTATTIYDLSARDPLPQEDVPSELENNKTVSQFEGITNMFSVPKYGGIDPNAVMAPWYWIIFGMMMGDAGYGLMMVVLISLFKKLMKPKGETGKLANVLLYSSVTTMIFGVLFGSYFGETWHPILFSPLDDPVKMLLVTLVVGVAHIFTGLVVRIINNVKAGRVWDAIFDQVSWMLVISGIGCIFLAPVRTVGIVLAVVGVGIILCTAGRAKKGVVGKITGGLVGLYGITNYLSDILSYSRILALSLATGVVGMVMNMLAGMIQGSIVGFVLSLVIYVVGHVFNLALGLLSAYVHDCRLQYIEFYDKFYEGNGRLFKPLSINPKYIQIHENGGN